MVTVNELIAVKGRVVHTVSESVTVFDAISMMVDKDIGSLVVIREGSPCGMLTERDYVRRVAIQRRSPEAISVREVMSSDLVCVRPDTDVEICMALMTHRRMRHLPVLEEAALVGLISIGDIVKHLARERETTIDELTHYIRGG